MSILVTGANGFVGLNLLATLLARGERVIGMSRTSFTDDMRAGFAGLPGEFVEIPGDVRDAALFGPLMKRYGIDRVAHMAAITADAKRERRAADEILAVNLGGLANVMTAAGNAGVKRFVYAGSIAVYGGVQPDGSLLEEDTPHAPQTLYGITKSAGEAVVARLGDLHGLDWTIGRLGRVFGPYEHETGARDTMSQIYRATLAARAGRAVTFARPCVKNWNYARDSASSLETLIMTPTHCHRVYNLGTPHAWPLSAWCERLAVRYPDFRFSVGNGEGEAIDLGGARDGGLLSWQRFSDEFGPAAKFNLDTAFADYMTFLESTMGLPAGRHPA